MNLTNLKAIFTKVSSSWSLKRKFDKTVGIYFDGSKVFCVSLNLISGEDGQPAKWKIVDTAEMTPIIKGQLSEKSRAILMQFDALDNDIVDENTSEEKLIELIAEKVASLCKNNWQINSVALCIDTDNLIVTVEDLSNIPKEKISNNVQYQIAVAGNFEADTYLYSFMETNSGVWMEGIAKAEASKYIQAFQKNEMQLFALTAMPDEIDTVEDIDLTGVDTNFLESGGMKAAFAARSLSFKTNPNFLQEQTVALEGWNYRRITAVIVLVTFLIMAVIGILDFWEYRQAKADLEYERSQIKLLESDRRKEEFIEKDLSELKNRNQIIATLSENNFPWRGLLVHFGTIKIQGVWLKDVRSLNDKSIEIKGEAVNYEAIGNYVRALENDSDVFKTVHLKSSEMKSDGKLLQFVIELSL